MQIECSFLFEVFDYLIPNDDSDDDDDDDDNDDDSTCIWFH